MDNAERDRRERDGGGRTSRHLAGECAKILQNLTPATRRRNIIQRNIAQLEEELLQYETNIGFFNASPDNPMVMRILGEKLIVSREDRSSQARLKVKEEIKNPTPAKAEG